MEADSYLFRRYVTFLAAPMGGFGDATLATEDESTDVHVCLPLVTCIDTIGFTTGANSCCVGHLPCCLVNVVQTNVFVIEMNCGS